MDENVKVVVRCRPINNQEIQLKCKKIVEIEDCCVVLKNPNDQQAPDKQFTYDSAYDSDSTTDSLYNDICFPLVESVLEGYNCTIFAYGQTGCGKSFTMQGIESTKERGVVSKTFEHIFESISVVQDVRYLVLVSYLEIYNENIRDLLKPATDQQNLQLKELPGDGILVQNLSQHTVINAKECEDFLFLGNKNRVVGGTLMNQNSSRSHSIFTISLEQIKADEIKKITTYVSDPNSNGNGIIKSKLNLVDLAGSERQNKTGATGDRFKEATKINLSLSALGNVISALVDIKTKHIPYRDSKLTRLLQDSLGGNTKTLMIACISPVSYNYDETLSTLRYASRAKRISNIPKINEDPKDTKLREYKEEILKLKALLQSTVVGITNSTQENQTDRDKLGVEKNRLQAEYNTETEKLRHDYENQKKEREDLVRDMELLKRHYETQLKSFPTADFTEQNNNFDQKNSMPHSHTESEAGQQEVLNRIEAIKNALVGGEKANDLKLKEKHLKKKLHAQHRLNSLALALSRIEENSHRDLLKEHYTDIQQELNIKTNAIKQYRFRIKQLDREINDLHSEFQLDRTDYLETIRKLERSLKFYQQLLDKALPILRKDGKYWDPDQIQSESFWNDDLKNWKLPESEMTRFKLPPASKPDQDNLLKTEKLNRNQQNNSNIHEEFGAMHLNIAESYFQFNKKNFNKSRITAATSDLIFQHRNGLKNVKEADITLKQKIQQSNKLKQNFAKINGRKSHKLQIYDKSDQITNANWVNLNSLKSKSLLSLAQSRNQNQNPILSLQANGVSISRTWSGLTQNQSFESSLESECEILPFRANSPTPPTILKSSPLLLPISSADSL